VETGPLVKIGGSLMMQLPHGQDVIEKRQYSQGLQHLKNPVLFDNDYRLTVAM